jgi:protein-disulfide isomerase
LAETVLDFARTSPSTSLGRNGRRLAKTFLSGSLAALALSATAAPGIMVRSWVTYVSAMPSGAYVLGNPNAKVRLVEYLSYTCSHCAEYVAESAVPLKRDHLERGLVAVEVRNAVRDRYDFAAALLARCGGPTRFTGNTESLMATQGKWLAKAPAFDAANGARMSKMALNDSLKFIARGLGLDAIMKSRGLAQAQIDACLINKPNQDKIMAMTNEAWNVRKISGTPTFLINNQPFQGPGHWSAIEPALKAALAAK